MWSSFLDFWSLSDPNVVWVLLGAVLLGATAGMIGTFAFVRQRALAGDALAHAALPGVTTAFILFQSRDPLVIIGGAFISCFLGLFSVEYLIKRTKVKEDSALAMVLSFFFAVGVFHLSYIQKLAITGQSGLDKLLFGQAASLVRGDVIILGLVATVILFFIASSFHKLRLISFDPGFARASGTRVPVWEAALAVALVLAVVIGLQLVGVVLMAALLLTPAASARYWSDDLKVVTLLAGVFGALSGVMGANISYLAPRMPTGPWIVVGLTLLFFTSMLFAPERGIVSRGKRRRRVARRIEEENVLRTLYNLHEQRRGDGKGVELASIMEARDVAIRALEATLVRAEEKGLVAHTKGRYLLTASGFTRAQEITRRHRLWEVYLTENLNLPPDHVHGDAELVEHVLTEELEQKLCSELGAPVTDPHGRSIPASRGRRDD